MLRFNLKEVWHGRAAGKLALDLGAAAGGQGGGATRAWAHTRAALLEHRGGGPAD